MIISTPRQSTNTRRYSEIIIICKSYRIINLDNSLDTFLSEQMDASMDIERDG